MILKILAIESSNQTMSVATMEDGIVVAEYTRNGNLQHSTHLMPAIEHVMLNSGWKNHDLEKIVVSKGPGSYTGIRIGATIAKTLAWTLNIPLVSISSLQLLAANVTFFDGYIVPIIDARRKNVYAAVYQMLEGTLTEVIPEAHIASEAFFEQIAKESGPFLFVGQDIPLYQDDINDLFGDRAQFASPKDWLPRAGSLAALGEESPAVDVHLFTPEYLKKSEAEENWQQAHGSEGEGDYVERID